MSSNDEEMISLNLSEKPVRDYSAYQLKCPNCGSTDYFEKRYPEDERGGLLANIEEYNRCNDCNTRFNDFGDIENWNHESRGILAVLGIMVGVAVVVAIASFILKLIGKV